MSISLPLAFLDQIAICVHKGQASPMMLGRDWDALLDTAEGCNRESGAEIQKGVLRLRGYLIPPPPQQVLRGEERV